MAPNRQCLPCHHLVRPTHQSGHDCDGDVARRAVGVVVPDQHLLDRAGAATVFQQQIDLLKDLKLRVQLYIIAPTPLAARLDLLGQAARDTGADDYIILTAIHRIRQRWRPTYQLLRARLSGRWDLRSDLATSDIVDTCGLAYSAQSMPDAVICNYLSGVSTADALVSRSRQILVLHDLPSQALSPRITKELRRRPHLVVLSGDDARCGQARLSLSSCHVGIPLPRQRPLAFDDLGGLRKLGDVIGASQPEFAGVWPAQSDQASLESLDLLFVGGKHPPNAEGLARFVETCFLPHLRGLGFRLVVAGGVGPELWKNGQSPSGVIALGRVANLRPLYAAAKLVIVPLLAGTGVSIKTLEAISLGKPVLSSPVGLRGLGGLESLALAPPFDGRWARRITQLLRSRQARRRLRDDLAGKLGQPTLESTLRDLLCTILGEDAVAARAPASRQSEAGSSPLVEWLGPPDMAFSFWAENAVGAEPPIERLVGWLTASGFGPRQDCQDLARDIARNREAWPAGNSQRPDL